MRDAKRQLSLLSGDHDADVLALVEAAVAQAEVETGRALITQTWTLTLDSFPNCIRLPRPPLQSVTSIKYIDTDGDQQTWGSSNYRVTSKTAPAVIEPAWGVSWPTIRTISEAIEIEYIAGYGDADSAVPNQVRQAIALMLTKEDLERDGHDTRYLEQSIRNKLRTVKVGGVIPFTGLRQA